ncbi:MAG TPA: hypothetical protein VIG89_09120 [Candidatus Acidoferrales bacterium]
MILRLCALALFLVLAAGVRADEIRLKDGSKIVGTIVDFENDSFKVQTSYGFALVRKDSIAQIIPSEPVKPSDPAKAVPPVPSPARSASAPATPAPAVSNASAAPSSPAARPEPQPAVARNSAPAPTPAIASVGASPAPSRAAAPVAATPAATPSAPAVAATVLPMPAPNPRPTSPATSPGTPTAASPAPAAAPPLAPLPVREFVQGNLYINQTYAFQLYRPPGWELIPEARKALPNAITAMGTSDETTLLVVGRETLRDSLEAHSATAERALRRIYENYRPLSMTRRTITGLPAVQWRFRGVADGHDWSVTALALARGSEIFTLLGMTYADSDLIQIRENVLAKMIASVQFISPR